MDAELLKHARTVDPTVLGRRVREARLARQLTQTAVAGKEMSTAYVSRIEAGQRRPDPELIAVLAERLGIPLDELVMGTSRDVVAEQRLALDWAQLSARTGDAKAALAQVEKVLASPASDMSTALRTDALRIKAAVLESAGSLDDAIILLEDLTEIATGDMPWLGDMIALARCYRVSGALDRAVATGERALTTLKDLGLAASAESTNLILSLAAAYFELGETGHAIRLSHRAIAQADAIGSTTARSLAYWNASIMESRQGRHASAVELARKSLAFFEVGDDFRRTATIRSQLGILQLRADAPDPVEALAHLRQAQGELESTDADASVKASNRLAQARAHYLMGDMATAREGAREAVAASSDLAPLVAADAYVLAGQVASVEHDDTEARRCYQSAAAALSGAGADRSAAQLWFGLGALLESTGDSDGALDAFKRAGASTGLTSVHFATRVHDHTTR